MSDFDTALRARAEQVQAQLCEQDEAWGTSGWTRRRFLAGAGMVGVAALGSQLVTARGAFAADASTTDRTLVVVFLRGAADGLRILQPSSSALGLDHLKQVRSSLVLPESNLIALPSTDGWGLNKQLQPLYDQLWATGELAFVPGISTSGVSRSHFQAQQYLEKGGSDTSSTGWLDRLLTKLGPGTTFRAIAQGSATPVSLSGPETSLAMRSLDDFQMPGWDDIRPRTQKALSVLYRDVAGPLGEDVPTTMSALSVAARIRAGRTNTVTYPGGDFAKSLKELAAILRAEVGLQVATVDVGGWDTHTDEAGDLDRQLAATANALKAFHTDLGAERRKRVTTVVMTEFGRRVGMNASGGTDHGHGSLMWLMGGGLAGSSVYGKWNQLAANSLDQGDVPGVNNPFDVLGELAQKRLNVGSLTGLFPNYTPGSLGVATA